MILQNKYKVEPNAVVYSSAISACARSDPPNFQMALQLLQDASPQHVNVVGYNAALSACARAGAWQSAIQLLEKMTCPNSLVVPDQVTYGTILAACEASQEWQFGIEICQQMQDEGMANGWLVLDQCLACLSTIGIGRTSFVLFRTNETLDISRTRTNDSRTTTNGSTTGIARTGFRRLSFGHFGMCPRRQMARWNCTVARNERPRCSGVFCCHYGM